jgi:hypothetical protein
MKTRKFIIAFRNVTPADVYFGRGREILTSENRLRKGQRG